MRGAPLPGLRHDVNCEAGSECYSGVFRDCTAHTASDPEQNVDGFALGHRHTRDFRFEHCTTYGVFDGFDVSGRNTTLDRCVARNCRNGGFKLWQSNIVLNNCLGYDNQQTNVELDWDDAVGPTMGTVLANCTFVNASVFNVVVENGASELRMDNTIVGGGDNIGLCFLAGRASAYSGDNNLFHNDNPNRWRRSVSTGAATKRNPWRLASSTNGRGSPLGSEDGFPGPCAVNLDHVQTVARSRLGALITTLPARRMDEMREALLFALGF